MCSQTAASRITWSTTASSDTKTPPSIAELDGVFRNRRKHAARCGRRTTPERRRTRYARLNLLKIEENMLASGSFATTAGTNVTMSDTMPATAI